MSAALDDDERGIGDRPERVLDYRALEPERSRRADARDRSFRLGQPSVSRAGERPKSGERSGEPLLDAVGLVQAHGFHGIESGSSIRDGCEFRGGGGSRVLQHCADRVERARCRTAGSSERRGSELRESGAELPPLTIERAAGSLGLWSGGRSIFGVVGETLCCRCARSADRRLRRGILFPSGRPGGRLWAAPFRGCAPLRFARAPCVWFRDTPRAAPEDRYRNGDDE